MTTTEARRFLQAEAPECHFQDYADAQLGRVTLPGAPFMTCVVTGWRGAPDEETWGWLGSGPGSGDSLVHCSAVSPVTKARLRTAIRSLR